MDLFKPFTTNEDIALAVVPRMSAELGLCGAAALIYLTRGRKTVYHRIIFAMSLMDFVGSCTYFLSPYPDFERGHAQCSVQGWLIQFNLASALWNGILSTNYFLRIYCEWKEARVAKLEKYFHALAWGFPLATATVSAVLDFYRGPPVTWCWISSDHDWARWAFYYGPLWTSMIWCLVSMRMVVRKVNTVARRAGDTLSESRRQKDAHVISQAQFYVFVFFMTWIFGTANRMQQAIDPGNPMFELVLLHALFVPAQGFGNFLVFFRPKAMRWLEDRGLIRWGSHPRRPSKPSSSSEAATAQCYSRSVKNLSKRFFESSASDAEKKKRDADLLEGAAVVRAKLEELQKIRIIMPPEDDVDFDTSAAESVSWIENPMSKKGLCVRV